jgi:hypothetical protein
MALHNLPQALRLYSHSFLSAGDHGLAISRCVGNRFLATGTTDSDRPRRRRAKARAPDTPFVKRRTSYLQELSRLRNVFQAETTADRVEDHAQEASRKALLEARSEARQAIKRYVFKSGFISTSALRSRISEISVLWDQLWEYSLIVLSAGCVEIVVLAPRAKLFSLG